MNSKPPFFFFYTADFIGGVILFSNEEVGIYVRLLCFEWENYRLPHDLALVAKIGCATEEAVARVLETKFKKDERGYFNARMEFERDRALQPVTERYAEATKHLPSTVEEAIAFATGSGVPFQFVKEVFLEHEGTTWTYASKPVTNFRSYIISRRLREKSFQAQRAMNATQPRRERYQEP